MNSKKKESYKKSSSGNFGSRFLCPVISLCLSLSLWSFPVLAGQNAGPAGATDSQPGALATAAPAGEQQRDQQPAGRITGRIVDANGTAVVAAKVRLTAQDQSQSVNQEVLTDDDGQFAFANASPGLFHLTISSAGFATQEFSGSLSSGENFAVPQIVLAIASVNTEVTVVPSQIEVAEEQVKEQEKQRALGIIPNFYVSYIANAAPLTPKQKFGLAWKTMVDPVTFGIAGAIAGVQQAQNDFSGYGQGAQGYAKRFGASYAADATGTLIGGAILPSLFKQDPRYFYKGSGSKRSRVLYAVANSVICKGDNGHWQANYSGILGSLAAGGISNLYYPAKDRNGAALTFENALIGIGATAAANILQEFVIRKLTPNVANHDPANGGKPLGPIGKVFSSLVHEGD